MKTAPALHPDIPRQLGGGKDLISEVERLANELASLMQEIHGRIWRIQIEHSDDVAFVMVVPRLDKRRATA